MPFALAAVELARRASSCSASSPTAYGVDDVHVGAEVELVVETLYADDEGDAHDLALAPASSAEEADQ